MCLVFFWCLVFFSSRVLGFNLGNVFVVSLQAVRCCLLNCPLFSICFWPVSLALLIVFVHISDQPRDLQSLFRMVVCFLFKICLKIWPTALMTKKTHSRGQHVKSRTFENWPQRVFFGNKVVEKPKAQKV